MNIMASIGIEEAKRITTRATAAGITTDELAAMVTDTHHSFLEGVSGRDARGIEQEIAQREIQNRRHLATDAQIAYITDLLAQYRGEYPSWFSGPTTRDAIQRLTRAEASMYIDSLKDAI